MQDNIWKDFEKAMKQLEVDFLEFSSPGYASNGFTNSEESIVIVGTFRPIAQNSSENAPNCA